MVVSKAHIVTLINLNQTHDINIRYLLLLLHHMTIDVGHNNKCTKYIDRTTIKVNMLVYTQ